MRESGNNGQANYAHNGKARRGNRLILVLAVTCDLVDELKGCKENVGFKIQTGSPTEAPEALQELKVALPGSMSGYSQESSPTTTGARPAASAGLYLKLPMIGPEAWKSPNKAEWCDCAQRWTQTKAKYDLSVNEQEKEALRANVRYL